MADWLLANTGTLTLAASTTTYCGVSGDMRFSPTENRSQAIARASYTWQNLLVYLPTNTSPNATTIKSRKNTANGNLAISVGASSTGLFEDTTNSDSLVTGDLIGYQVVTLASAAGTINKISTTLNDAGTNPPQIASDASPIGQAFGTTFYYPLEGVPSGSASTLEANVQDRYTTQSTMTRLRVFVNSNSVNAASTVTLRKNATAGTNTVSVGNAATGTFEDTTHTDTLTASDLVDVQVVTGGTSGTLFMPEVQTLTVAAGRRMQSNFTRNAITQAFGVTAPYHLEGGTATVTEANAQLKTRLAFIFKNLFYYTPTNTVNGTSTLTLRVGGADSTLTVSIGSSATGAFEDTTNSVTTTATDLVNWQLVTAGSSGTMTLQTIGVEQTNPAGVTGIPPGLGPYVGLDQPSRDFGAALRM